MRQKYSKKMGFTGCIRGKLSFQVIGARVSGHRIHRFSFVVSCGAGTWDVVSECQVTRERCGVLPWWREASQGTPGEMIRVDSVRGSSSTREI